MTEENPMMMSNTFDDQGRNDRLTFEQMTEI